MSDSPLEGARTQSRLPHNRNAQKWGEKIDVPAAMPTINAKMTNAVSRVSSTTVRNRTSESAPTRLNARATLEPMTMVVASVDASRESRPWDTR